MKLIALTNGFFAKVDDEDYDNLVIHKWYADKIGNTFYAKRRVYLGNGRGRSIYMHRQIMNPKKGKLVDHKNHDGLDNQKLNLRECSKGQNQINQRSQKNSSSKYLGVSWDKSRNKWQAHVAKNYKVYSCGRHLDEVEAAKAYNKKAFELHGEFANLNHV